MDSEKQPKQQVRTMQFGVLRVLSGEQRLLEAMALQQELWNQLTGQEGESRKRFRQWTREADPQLGTLEARIEELKQRGRGGDDQVKRDVGRELIELTTTARERRDVLLKARAEEVRKMRGEQRKTLTEIGKASGLWWSHKEAVLENFETSRWTAIKAGSYLWPRAFTGDGTLTAKLTSGSMHATYLDLLNTRSQVASLREAAPAELSTTMKTLKGDGGKRMVLRVCVAAGKGDDDRHAELLFTQHREIEPTTRIRQVIVTRRAVAGSLTRGTWSVGLVVEREAPSKDPQRNGEAAVRIEAAASQAAHGRRLEVARVKSPEGEFTVTLEESWFALLDNVQRLREAKKRAYDHAIAHLTGAVEQLTREPAAPGSFADDAKQFMTGQLGLRPLERLLRNEGANRTVGPTATGLDQAKAAMREAIAAAEAADLAAKKAARYRLHAFRVAASRICKSAREVKLEVVTTPEQIASDPGVPQLPQGFSAGCAVLVLAIERAASGQGIKVKRVRAPGTKTRNRLC
jgi:hypothetical protein